MARACVLLSWPPRRGSISKYKFMTGSDLSPNANRGLTQNQLPRTFRVVCGWVLVRPLVALSSSRHETNVLRRRHTSPPHKHNSQWIITGLKSVQVANKLQATLHGCLFYEEKARAVEHNVSVSDHVDHLLRETCVTTFVMLHGCPLHVPRSTRSERPPKLDCASIGRVELCFTTTETDGCLLQAPVTQHDLCEWQWKVVTLWRVARSPAESESLRPTSAIIPSCTDTCGSRRKHACCVLLGHRSNCFTARLLSVVGLSALVRTTVGWRNACLLSKVP